jgi:hypothetical protein
MGKASVFRIEQQEYPKQGKALNDSFLTTEAGKAATNMAYNIVSKTLFRECHHQIVSYIVTSS